MMSGSISEEQMLELINYRGDLKKFVSNEEALTLFTIHRVIARRRMAS